MLPHEILICAISDRASRAYRMEWMASLPIDEGRFGELCNGTGGLIYRLIALWEQEGRRPILLKARDGVAGSNPGLAGEIHRLELDNVAAHGIPDPDGCAASFFCFSKLPDG